MSVVVGERPCPGCGYDLRASRGRCPECGAAVPVHFVAGRIPWAHRKTRGAVRAYVATVWMVVARPWRLAEEGRVRTREARGFHWVSVGLAVVLGLVALVAVHVMRIEYWGALFHPTFPAPRGDDSWWDTWLWPAKVVSGSPWAAVAMGGALPSFFIGVSAAYRGLLGLAGARGVRRRVRRLALYASGILPVMTMLMGVWLVVGAAMEQYPGLLSGGVGHALFALRWGAGMAAAAVFFWTTGHLVARTGKYRWARGALLTIPFPVFVFAAGVVIGVSWFWACGYAALAIHSMFH